MMAISTGMGLSTNNDDEQSPFECFSPKPIATMETNAIVASKISTTSPMRSAPRLGNFPVPQSRGSPYESSRIYIEQQRHPQQSLPKQQTTEPAKAQHANNTSEEDRKKIQIVRRSGKWTAIEEQYVNILIELFEEGRIDEYEKRMDSNIDKMKLPKVKIENGMTLRAYLSRKLFCSPMRISKKFAGRGIGKLVYMSQRPGSFYAARQRFGFSSGPISNDPTGDFWTANDWNKLNRLKEAESDFLKLAFPQKHSTSHNASSASHRDRVADARGNSSQSTAQKVPIMPASSLTNAGIRQPIIPSAVGGYQSSLRNNELIHYQHNHEVPHERKRQRVDDEKQSSVQALEEAYISSISPNKSQKSDSARVIIDKAQHLMTTDTLSNSIDWNRPTSDSTEAGVNVPNFLVGFDNVSESQPTTNLDQQIIENSPAYHTSSSFDDFHRFLGKGLSPAPSSNLKFPNLRSIPSGPTIPSTQLGSPASVSKLQRRPHNPQNTAPDKIGNREEKSLDLTPIRRNTSRECPPNQTQQPESSDYPIEGMMFEDFNTLAACYNELVNPVSGARAVISDGSDCTQSEDSFPDRVRYSSFDASTN